MSLSATVAPSLELAAGDRIVVGVVAVVPLMSRPPAAETATEEAPARLR